MRAAIFIDGGYFFNHMVEEGPRIDFDRLAQYLAAPLKRGTDLDLMRCYFYYCAPWMSEQPTEEELRRMRSHHQLVDHIERTRRWQVKLGKLEQRWEGRRPYYEQKRVDVLLSVDLVRHAAGGHIQHAILVAGDSDFIPAIAAAKENGVTVSLWGGPVKSVHADLEWMVDELHYFDRAQFGAPAPRPPESVRRKEPRAPNRRGDGKPRPSGPKRGR